MSIGQVYLVGAGSGDPELITLKAINAIKNCDVIIYDRLANDSFLNYGKEGCKKIYVGKAAGSHYMQQDEINQVIVDEALKNQVVVRLKGGDPFVFGRGGEEILALKKHDIPYTVISGISSCISVPAAAGIPVTHRDLARSFTVITGHTSEHDETGENFSALAQLSGTLVFLMGLSNIEKISSSLIENGKSKNTPAAVISEGTTKKQTVVKATLENIAQVTRENNIKSPAIIVVGDVCGLDFSETLIKPLKNVKIGLTGTPHFNKKLEESISYYGGSAYNVSTLNVVELNKNELIAEIENISNYSWASFTSTNGVDLFFKALYGQGKDIRTIAHLKFAVIGKGTADTLLKYGIKADLMPEQYMAADLAELMATSIGKNENILMPCAKQSSVEVDEILSTHKLNKISIYDVVLNTDNISAEEMDYTIFGSSSAVKSYFENNLPIGKTKHYIAIGPVTEEELKKYNITPIVANSYTVDGIVNKILLEVEKNA